ncbi:hypothetical protein DM02DRAFT_617435 [Periconia macrospinosa]|uniref:Jacalin-type lectin domain-containing protein n=1 Tax=Periconia macrospinosa TaxID=97972 RepID=A0A2V1DD73_9PLEO|nr:hypothetical protein DM02DRAFT_617435 [Periconia macrospinosa]
MASLPLFQSALADSQKCNMPQGPYSTSVMVGLGGERAGSGNWFCLSEWQNGDVITGVEAWASDFAVEGIKFWYANGRDSPWYGRPLGGGGIPEGPTSHPDKPYKWDSTSQVQIRLWGNKGQIKGSSASNAIGRIQILDKDGNEKYNVAATKKGAVQDAYAQLPADGGIVMGVKVRADKWVSNLEFFMLKSPVASGTLTDVKYEKDVGRYAKENGGIEQATLASVYYKNSNSAGGSNVTYRFANSVTKAVKKSVSVTKSNTWSGHIGIETGGSFGIPGVVEVKNTIKYDFSYERTEAKTEGKDEDLSRVLNYEMGSGAANNMLAPGKAAYCKAWSTQGTFSSDYTATMQAKLDDGTRFEYKVKGHVDTVGWTDAVAECKEMDIKDIPADAKEGETSPVNKRALLFKA